MTALAVGACGVEKADPPDGPDVRTCAGNWRVLLSPTEQPLFFQPTLDQLKWNQGRLYFTLTGFGRDVTSTSGIFALDPAGGSPVPIEDGGVLDFWFEDDRILYFAYGSNALYSAPAAGGPADLVMTSQLHDIRRSISGVALDRQALYWGLPDRDDRHRWQIWKEPRDGGEPTMLASIALPSDQFGYAGFVKRMVVLPDRVLVLFESTADGAQVWSVALDGGGASALPSFPGYLVGVAPDGTALWQRYAGGFDGTRGSDRYEIGQTHADGTAAGPFWAGKPPNADPTFATGDGAAGFYVAALQMARDESPHAEVWNVDAGGTGRLLGCDPEVAGIMHDGVAVPGAFYGLVRYDKLYWTLIEVDAAVGGGAR